MPAPPKVDPRTAEDIARQLRALLVSYVDAWRGSDPQSFKPDSLTTALICIFGRFAEILIDRLNRVPEKNFLAYLDLLGASLLPPQPARVPLTFSLAAGSTVDAKVPAGTQVAAPPGAGETAPVIFETERELVVTAAQLVSVYVRDPELDQYADCASILTTPAANGAPVFRGNTGLGHILYLGHDVLLSYPVLGEVRLTFELDSNIPAPADPRSLQWEVWDGAQGSPIAPSSDGTANLTSSGRVTFRNLPQVPQAIVQGLQSRWLRCRLLTPATSATEPRSGMVRASHLPSVKVVSMQAVMTGKGLSIETAFQNALPIDLSKDFFPFGEKPRFGDVLYLASSEAFSKGGAQLTLNVDLTNPASGGPEPPIPRVYSDGKPQIQWEYWDGEAWVTIKVDDGTHALTTSGTIEFKLSTQPAKTVVSGSENFWIRARLTGGNYGSDAYYEPQKDKDGKVTGYVLVPGTIAPPLIRSIKVDYSVTQPPRSAPAEALVTCNDFAYKIVSQAGNAPAQSFSPFQPAKETRPSLYLGFALPPGRDAFPNEAISLLGRSADFKYGEKSVPLWPDHSKLAGDPGGQATHVFSITDPAIMPGRFRISVLGASWKTTVMDFGKPLEVDLQVAIPAEASSGSSDRAFLVLSTLDPPYLAYSAEAVTFAGSEVLSRDNPKVVWEYWNGAGWVRLGVRDDTENFTRTGLIEFLAPADFARDNQFGSIRYWVRVRWESGEYSFGPRLRRVLLNTTMAAQTASIRNEILGSSDGSKNQQFSITQAPVLAGPRLQVREPEMPSAEGQAALRKEEGEDAISVMLDASGRPSEIWVRWHEVPDFYASGARDRHYVLDHLSGEIRFGDGLSGMIPPRGTNNLRMVKYQTGGGTAGNKPAGVIVQMKTTVPYVDKVTNTEAAAGGADAEVIDSLIQRAPRTVRHRDRAATREDYVDLAMLASPEVARALCLPLYDVSVDPDATRERSGVVSVIIVPHSTDPKPLPSLELIERVGDYLKGRQIPTANLVVVGPEYIRVDVEAEVALLSLEGAAEIQAAIRQALSGFLHPLAGGLDGKGWDFGRRPHKSDLFRLIESVPGVDHVRTLRVNEIKDRAEAKDTSRFLVYSGEHKVDLIFESG